LRPCIDRYFEAGTTEVVVTQTGMNGGEDRRRTWRLLGELNRPGAAAARVTSQTDPVPTGWHQPGHPLRVLAFVESIPRPVRHPGPERSRAQEAGTPGQDGGQDIDGSGPTISAQVTQPDRSCYHEPCGGGLITVNYPVASGNVPVSRDHGTEGRLPAPAGFAGECRLRTASHFNGKCLLVVILLL
jgi:hypothetical protein